MISYKDYTFSDDFQRQKENIKVIAKKLGAKASRLEPSQGRGVTTMYQVTIPGKGVYKIGASSPIGALTIIIGRFIRGLLD